METDWNTIVNLGWGAMLSIVGWFTRQLWDAVKEMKKDLHAFKVQVPTLYATKSEISDQIREMKSDHREDMREIKDICRQIFDKLDAKEDKDRT